MTISLPSSYLTTVRTFNPECSATKDLIDPLISLQHEAHKGLQSLLTQKLSQLSPERFTEVLKGTFEKAPSNAMVATLKKIVTLPQLEQVLGEKKLQTNVPLFAKDYTRFLPTTAAKTHEVTLKTGFFQSLGWFGKLLNTIFFTFTQSYNIDVNNPPKDQYRAQSQMMFLRAAVSDALIIGGIIVAAFVTNVWVGVAAVAVTLIALIVLVIVYRILKNRCPEQIQDCTNLTLQAEERKILPSIGRDAELKRVIDALSTKERSDGANVMLLGEPGVGKTQIAHELARRIAEGSVPDSLKKKRVFAINTAKLLSGEITFDQNASRVENPLTTIFNAVLGHEDEVIFFIDEIHVAGQEPSSSMGNQAIKLTELLKTELDNRNITCIVATTTKEYEETLKSNEAFIQRFTSITIAAPSDDELNLILERYMQTEGTGITLTAETRLKVIAVANTLFPAQANPRKAKKLLKHLINHVRCWAPKEINIQLEAQKLRREKLLAEGREKRHLDASWLPSADTLRDLAALDAEIARLESAKKTETLALAEIRSLSALRTENQTTLHALAQDMTKQLDQIEFVLRSLFLREGLQSKQTALKTAFKSQYNEDFVDTIDEALLEKVREELSQPPTTVAS